MPNPRCFGHFDPLSDLLVPTSTASCQFHVLKRCLNMHTQTPQHSLPTALTINAVCFNCITKDGSRVLRVVFG